MRTHRRGFLGLAAGALGALALAERARGEKPSALEIHRITSNTRLRALRTRLRAWRGAAPTPKAYSGEPRLPLPEARPGTSPALAATVRGFAPAAGFRTGALPLAGLARLLHLTNGVTGELRLDGARLPVRAAPSAGALYAGEVYLAAERVQGLAPGLYHFSVLERALVRLREGPRLAELAAALEEPECLDGALFAVLLTNVFGRYTARYASRGYRYALIDTGHIAENLRLAAAAAGLGERSFARFEDARLDALLGLDASVEATCWVSAVGVPATAAGAGSRDPQPALRALVERSPAAALAPRGSAERYHAATRLVPSAQRAPPEVSEPDRALDGLALETREAPAASVEAAIRARRSALGFRAEPIATSDLAFVLEMARAHPALARAPGVELHLVAHRVAGLVPGHYACDGRRVALRRPGDLRGALVAACLGQEKAGDAAAALVLAARPTAAAARSGARAYRDLLVESGAVAQRIYLAAEALGLAARNLAAYWDADLDALLGFGSDGRAALHLTLLGREA